MIDVQIRVYDALRKKEKMVQFVQNIKKIVEDLQGGMRPL